MLAGFPPLGKLGTAILIAQVLAVAGIGWNLHEKRAVVARCHATLARLQGTAAQVADTEAQLGAREAAMAAAEARLKAKQ